MEIKMLKTQIAVYKMEKQIQAEAFHPQSTSTPRGPRPPPSESPPTKDRSLNISPKFLNSSARQMRSTLDYFLLNESSFIEKSWIIFLIDILFENESLLPFGVETPDWIQEL